MKISVRIAHVPTAVLAYSDPVISSNSQRKQVIRVCQQRSAAETDERTGGRRLITDGRRAGRDWTRIVSELQVQGRPFQRRLRLGPPASHAVCGFL
jgi:hypothetical protein